MLLSLIVVVLGFERNFTVPEDVHSFRACFQVINPPNEQELAITINLVVETIEGTAGILFYKDISHCTDPSLYPDCVLSCR